MYMFVRVVYGTEYVRNFSLILRNAGAHTHVFRYFSRDGIDEDRCVYLYIGEIYPRARDFSKGKRERS